MDGDTRNTAIVEMLRRGNSTFADAGVVFGLTRERVRQIAKQHGITGSALQEFRRRRILELRDAGMLYREIAAEAGCSSAFIAKVLLKARCGRPPCPRTQRILELKDSGPLHREIADKVGCGRQRVSRVLLKHGHRRYRRGKAAAAQ